MQGYRTSNSLDRLGRFWRWCVVHKRRRRVSLPMMIRVEPVPFEPPRAPAWARPGGSFREISEAEALFFAGAALSALDSVARSDPPWAGVWRRRLALKSAAAVAQNLLNRREDEAALRDAVALAGPGRSSGRREGSIRRSGRSAVPATLSPRAPRRRRGRPAVAARPGQGGGPRRRAGGGGRARPAGPDRRGRGRRSGDRAARRRRAARASLRRRRVGQKPRLAVAAAAPRRRAVRAPRHRRGTAAAPGRGRLEQARGARLRSRGARRPRPGAGPVAPRRPARRRRAKTARQREGEARSRRCSPTTPSPPRRPLPV